jgi:hypothetical protein
MKLQYLGDSKDCFKWDYHDYLTSALGYSTLNVVPMLTGSDKSGQGETHLEDSPFREQVIAFCRDLNQHQSLERIRKLPEATGARYCVELHRGQTYPYLTNHTRREYFSGFSAAKDQVLFLDPDNGFQPEKSFNNKHVLYSEVDAVLGQVSDKTVISVFQHFRRKSFEQDFACIEKRILRGYATALYWKFLMFVAVTKTKAMIEKVAAINRQYAKEVSGLRSRTDRVHVI